MSSSLNTAVHKPGFVESCVFVCVNSRHRIEERAVCYCNLRRRTLHEAQVAEDTKWIAQQWLAWGVTAATFQSDAAPGFEELLKQRKQGGGKKAKKAKAPATKGFGRR